MKRKKEENDFKSLGRALNEAKDLIKNDEEEEACKLLEPYLDEFPDNPVLLDELINCYCYNREFEKAIQLLRRLLDLVNSKEHTEITLDRMSDLFVLAEKYDEALKICNIQMILIII